MYSLNDILNCVSYDYLDKVFDFEDKMPLIKSLPKKRHHKLIYKLEKESESFSDLYNKYIRNKISLELNCESEGNLHFPVELSDIKEQNSIETHIQTCIKRVKNNWNCEITELNKNLISKLYSCCVDIITEDSIFNVVHTSSLSSKERHGDILKLLLASCFDKKTKAGLIFSLQGEIITFDLRKFDKENFILECIKCTTAKHSILPFNIYKKYNIGASVNMLNILNHKSGNTKVCQTSISDEIPKEFLIKLGNNINNNNISVYVHSPFNINLCQNNKYQENLIMSEFEKCHIFKAKGLVVHTGRRKNQSKKQGLEVMKINITKYLIYATKSCPLLIETPCGSGKDTTTCETIEEFIDFMEYFKDDDRIAVCIDTCHVHAAGYSCSWYLSEWLKKSSVNVKLIHFNDSKDKKGSKKDNHEVVPLGYVEPKDLIDVALNCTKNHIDMVSENK